MKLILAVLLSLVFSLYSYPQGRSEEARDNLEYYRELNNREIRLQEFKDNDEALKIKLMHLDVINRSRKKFRVPPVKLDILASRVANKMCREAAENSYISHWNLAGEKPYHRYAFAGGYDHVSENAFGEWTTGTYDNSYPELAKRMESGHASFMSEKAPKDGHKKNIIAKTHNYVGIGYYAMDKQFRYYEEFIDRYFGFENIPSTMRINEPASITVKTDGSFFLYFLIIYREKFPSPMTPSQLKKTGSYEDFSREEYIKMSAWELAGRRNGNSYLIPLKFNREGLYYVHIYFDKKEITKPSTLNTKGKTEGSGIVIRVDK
jgi:uncharacterized protein YkwD